MAMSQRMWIREQERKKRERIRRARRRRNCAIIVLLLAIIAVVVIVAVNNDGGKNTEKPTVTADATAVVDTTVAAAPYTTTTAVEDIRASFYKDSAFAGNALAQTIGSYGILKDSDFYAGVNIDLENVYKTTALGSTTSVVEQFKSKQFDKVFLSFGENEISQMSSTEFKEQYAELIDKIQEYQPNSRIYLIGIPPVTAQVSNSGGDLTVKKIMEFNKRIMSIAVDKEIYYIDSVDALGDNKDFLPNGVSYDGINLNKAATIDLLYYMTKEAYIPDSDDLAGLDSDDDDESDEEDDKSTPSPKKTAKPSPSPTVNVFKDKQNKGDND